MGKTFIDITMSIDGFVAAEGVDLAHPLGNGGDCIHDWIFKNSDATDQMIVQEMFLTAGAFVMGRRTFDVGEAHWGEDGTFHVPCFVVTHRRRQTFTKGQTSFIFVVDSIRTAIEMAKLAAGDKDVCVMGGASIVQQALEADVVDEIRIHIANLLLGTGTRLFEDTDSPQFNLVRTRVLSSPTATHLSFRVVGR